MRRNKPITLTHDRLLEALSYNPENGLFTWNINRRKVSAGDIAGSPTNQGYIRIMIDQDRFLAHRLAWFYMNKEWPENEIDHINRDQSDNRYINLRSATRQQNELNRGLQSNNTSGYIGAVLHKDTGKYAARVKIKGKEKHLGMFTLAIDAHNAYRNKMIEMHGENYMRDQFD